jgi:acetyl esterase/lipase
MLMGLVTAIPAQNVVVESVGPISLRVHRPVSSDGRLPALLWIHGGGYVMGKAALDDAVCRHFAEKLGIVVAAVDYPNRVAVGGASAGGGLAAAVALLAHERGDVPIAFQLLIYPMLDDRTAARNDLDETRFRLWNQNANRFGWQAYTGHLPGSVEVSGLAAPARYQDLSGLAPAWIGVGTLDLFYEEDVAYASRLKDAGVECELDIVDGAFHGFDNIRPKARVSQAFRCAQVAALAAALGCPAGAT